MARCSQVVRRYPSTIILPLVVLAGLLGISIWGVEKVAGHERIARRVRMGGTQEARVTADSKRSI